MKTGIVSFFAVSAILAVLLAACFNPIGFTPDGLPEEDAGGEGGADAGIPDTGAFTVTIPVNPESDGATGRAAAAADAGFKVSDTIKTGGVINTLFLVVLDEEGKVADSLEASTVKAARESEEDSLGGSVILPRTRSTISSSSWATGNGTTMRKGAAAGSMCTRPGLLPCWPPGF